MKDEHAINDPQLQSLEARLGAMAPKAPLAEQRKLLFQCGYAAGERALRGALRRWQAAAATLCVVSLGMAVALAPKPTLVKSHRMPAVEPVHGLASSSSMQAEIPAEARQSQIVALDAWQSPPSEFAALANQLARFKQADPDERSLAVSALSRSILAQ